MGRALGHLGGQLPGTGINRVTGESARDTQSSKEATGRGTWPCLGRSGKALQGHSQVKRELAKKRSLEELGVGHEAFWGSKISSNEN